jgi:hypothetical protein
VLAGINKAIQTVTVFVVSTVFCSVQPSQCFSWSKAVSLVLVVIGVLLYSHASSFVEVKPGYTKTKSSELDHDGGHHGQERSRMLPFSGSSLESWTTKQVEQWVTDQGEGFKSLASSLSSIGVSVASSLSSIGVSVAPLLLSTGFLVVVMIRMRMRVSMTRVVAMTMVICFLLFQLCHDLFLFYTNR